MNALSHPLIAIMGTTGVGKSQLAVELALRLTSSLRRTAKVINADAMQTYIGLDVIINKISVDEMQGVPHCLININNPGQEYKLADWIKDALRTIRSIHEEGGIPIVVGGTSYWVQHLLLHSKLPSLQTSSLSAAQLSNKEAIETHEEVQTAVSGLSTELHELWQNLPETSADITDDTLCMRLYNLLKVLDSRMAERWHWRDSRKVLRSVQIIKQSGMTGSKLLATQEEEGVPEPRFPCIVFWLYSKPDSLGPRLDTRVEQMLKNGLVSEITTMRSIAAKIQAETGLDPRTLATMGIFQSIGYKEFDTYLSSPSPTEAQFDEGVASTKRATRNYAKHQVAWMKNKFLPAVVAAKTAKGHIDVFVLDATDLGKWEEQVRDVAVDLTMKFVQQKELPESTSLSGVAAELLVSDKIAASPLANLARHRKHTCPTCSHALKRPMMYDEGRQWEEHLRSRSHRMRKEKKEREEDPQWIGNVKRRERENQKRGEIDESGRETSGTPGESGDEGEDR